MMNQNYKVIETEDLSTPRVRRLVGKIVLSDGININNVEGIIQEITDLIKKSEVYKNETSRLKWRGRSAQVVWLYLTYDTNWVRRGIYWLRTQWIDHNLAEKAPLPLSENKFANGIIYEENNMYKNMVDFETENQKSKKDALQILNILVNKSNILVDEVQKVMDKISNSNTSFDELCSELLPYK